jgi:hypothetical protein
MAFHAMKKMYWMILSKMVEPGAAVKDNRLQVTSLLQKTKCTVDS